MNLHRIAFGHWLLAFGTWPGARHRCTGAPFRLHLAGWGFGFWLLALGSELGVPHSGFLCRSGDLALSFRHLARSSGCPIPPSFGGVGNWFLAFGTWLGARGAPFRLPLPGWGIGFWLSALGPELGVPHSAFLWRGGELQLDRPEKNLHHRGHRGHGGLELNSPLLCITSLCIRARLQPCRKWGCCGGLQPLRERTGAEAQVSSQ